MTKKLLYNYDFGDNWIVEITRHPTVTPLPEQDDLNETWIAEAMTIVNDKHRPVYIQQKGGYVMDDVGGIGSFAAFLATINQSPGTDERQELRTWATSMGLSNRKINLTKML